MMIYLALLGGLGWLFMQLPRRSFPNEDQGFVIVDMQLPSEATQPHRGYRAGRSDIFSKEPAVERHRHQRLLLLSAGQNAGLAFVTLKDW